MKAVEDELENGNEEKKGDKNLGQHVSWRNTGAEQRQMFLREEKTLKCFFMNAVSGGAGGGLNDRHKEEEKIKEICPQGTETETGWRCLMFCGDVAAVKCYISTPH